MKEEKTAELIERYGIDLRKLKLEQLRLAKNLEIKDSKDFSKVEKIGAISNIFHQNKIISALVVLNTDFEIIEEKYFSDKLKFPYIPGFRAYREVPNMVRCFELAEEKPEVVFIEGHGILHERLGIASHFSLAAGVPAIGVSDSLVVGETDKDDVKLGEKIVGKSFVSKNGARPLYVSPGNMISVKSALELTKRFTREGKKLPEPLRESRRYAREVLKELH